MRHSFHPAPGSGHSGKSNSKLTWLPGLSQAFRELSSILFGWCGVASQFHSSTSALQSTLILAASHVTVVVCMLSFHPSRLCTFIRSSKAPFWLLHISCCAGWKSGYPLWKHFQYFQYPSGLLICQLFWHKFHWFGSNGVRRVMWPIKCVELSCQHWVVGAWTPNTTSKFGSTCFGSASKSLLRIVSATLHSSRQFPCSSACPLQASGLHMLLWLWASCHSVGIGSMLQWTFSAPHRTSRRLCLLRLSLFNTRTDWSLRTATRKMARRWFRWSSCWLWDQSLFDALPFEWVC